MKKKIENNHDKIIIVFTQKTNSNGVHISTNLLSHAHHTNLCLETRNKYLFTSVILNTM